MPKKKAIKAVKAWAGFYNGRIHKTHEHSSYSYESDVILAIYPNQRVAKENYEVVRRVEIRVID